MRPWLQKSRECWKYLKIEDFMKMLNITTLDEARALWFAVANKFVWVNDAKLDTGGSLFVSAMYIASALKGVQMDDILCQEGTYESRERIAQLFMDHLVYTDGVHNREKYPWLRVSSMGEITTMLRLKIERYRAKRNAGKPGDIKHRTIKVPYIVEK